MRVSVVVPTYNAAARLRLTLASVLAQTRPAHEVIVVDDGSTDDTPAVCAAFGAAIQYVAVPNGGQQRARNLGVERATGDWIALLDHDDLWDPDYLFELAEFQARHAFELCFCDSRIVRDDAAGNALLDENRFLTHAPTGYWRDMAIDDPDRWSVLERYDFAHYLAFHPAQPSVMTIRKTLYERLGGYDPAMRGSSAENFEFELRAIRTGRVGLIWRPLVTITRHPGNASVDGGKMAMDLVDCLRFVGQHHALSATERAALDAELQRRLPAAIDGAFTLRRFAALCDYQALLTAPTDMKTRVKLGIARLPRPVARICAEMLTRRAA